MATLAPWVKGWLKPVLTAPFTNMHTRLHRIRMAMPPAEKIEGFHPPEPRPYKPTGIQPPKPPQMRVATAPAERRATSPIPKPE